MTYALFITEAYLKKNTPGNIASEDIYMFAKTAEDTHVQERIGTLLYDRLVASRLASPPDSTADEIVLLTKIREALIWLTCYDALPFIWIKLRGVGLVKQNGDNMETASMAEMNFMQKQLKNKADFYMRLVENYLCENVTLFPLYKSTTLGISPSDTTPGCALVFDKNDN